MFASSWGSLGRVLVVGLLTYAALVSVLRISGKRTLATLNAFDLVITVALGSTFATVLLSKEVAFPEGLLAFATLAALQFCLTWASRRWSWLEKVAKSQPRVVLLNGDYRSRALDDERVTKDEVRAAVRKAGHGDVGKIAAVVLETDGSLSVISRDSLGDGSAMQGLDTRDHPDRE